MKKYNHYETGYLLNIIREIISSKKIVFIIDKDEFFDKKIVLRQVIIDIGSNIAFMDKI
ncbi:hypothetical protein [Lacinutrix jangbogonensis]|uniref:hypothetical protein n=1 Tax=Lacinutrix jangbogonensis TaxID=1469557 RepID=UPI000B046477|nr:hypothetical protein [Lacinutrix jangbogonensis]